MCKYVGCSMVKRQQMKHGLRNHRLYRTWQGMMSRCYNPKATSYKYYGAEGISVCDEWHNVATFINDMFPSFIEGLTLDRKKTSKNYSKDNCRWASKEVQNRNTRKIMITNKSGYRGVYWHKHSNKWVSRISVNRINICIGYFNTALEAAKVYDNYVLSNNLEHTINGV